MDVLIVFAHPEPASFGAALKNEAVAALTAAGHAVTVSDLYAMDWTPALGPDEFAHDRSNADFLGLSREQEHAHRHGSRAADVRAEQAKVATADLVLFHFPSGRARRIPHGVSLAARRAGRHRAAVLPSVGRLRREPAAQAGCRRAVGRAVESAALKPRRVTA